MTIQLDRLYGQMERLRSLPGQGLPLRDYTGRSSWPDRGVYFFLDPGQSRANGRSPRIVRVGTHALTENAKSKLWGRLRAHRGSVDGRGNHRGSIFRLHVGAALLERDGRKEDFSTWGVGQSASRAVRDSEVAHERRVSDYLGKLPVLWVAVPDPPGPESARGYIERNAIALLSNRLHPIDPPNDYWLGAHSRRHEIRESGLWNLNHVEEDCDSRFLDTLEDLVMRMARPTSGPHVQ